MKSVLDQENLVLCRASDTSFPLDTERTENVGCNVLWNLIVVEYSPSRRAFRINFLMDSCDANDRLLGATRSFDWLPIAVFFDHEHDKALAFIEKARARLHGEWTA